MLILLPLAVSHLLPFFVLFVPVVALVFGSLWPRGAAPAPGVAMLAAARPLIHRRGHMAQASVLALLRESLCFVNAPEVERACPVLAEAIQAAGCPRIGLMLSGASMGYPLWALLGAPRDDLRLEWIVAGRPSERYERMDFHPCAVVCQNCPVDWDRVRGLPLRLEVDGFRLYLEGGGQGE